MPNHRNVYISLATSMSKTGKFQLTPLVCIIKLFFQKMFNYSYKIFRMNILNLRLQKFVLLHCFLLILKSISLYLLYSFILNYILFPNGKSFSEFNETLVMIPPTIFPHIVNFHFFSDEKV